MTLFFLCSVPFWFLITISRTLTSSHDTNSAESLLLDSDIPWIIPPQCLNDDEKCMNTTDTLNTTDSDMPQIEDEDHPLSPSELRRRAQLKYQDADLSLNPEDYDYGTHSCPGLAAGYECDYSSSWSSRDGDHYFCDIDVIHINDLTLSPLLFICTLTFSPYFSVEIPNANEFLKSKDERYLWRNICSRNR